MDGQTITRLAKAHATLITQYTGLSQAEAISLASQIVQFVAGYQPGAASPESQTSSQPGAAPAQSQERAQEAPGHGAILAKTGHRCYCSSCKSEVYEVIKDVRGSGMGINAFCQAFLPVGHSKQLTRDNLDIIKDPDGNVFIDCPSCGGSKSLMLIGTPKKGEAPQSTLAAPVVNTVTPDEISF